MCLSPQIIKNVNRNILSQNTEFAPYFDTSTSHICVPCGRCASCIALKQQYIVQRVQMEEKDNLIFMGMLSYNSETLPCINVNGYPIKYADPRHIQDMFRYIRKWENLLPFRYMAVSEFGSSDSKSHRPHWHFFFFYPKESVNNIFNQITRADCDHLQVRFWKMFLKYWRHNVGTRKNPVWKPNLTYKQIGRKRNYDLQYVDTLQDYSGAPFYVSKYVTKSSSYVDRLKSALYFNLDSDEYSKTWKLVKPRFLFSKGFGNPQSDSVARHIRLGIECALDDPDAVYPYYISPHNGSIFPLAPYYRDKFLTADEELVFKSRLLALSETGVISDLPIDTTPDEIFQKERRFERVKKFINARDEDLSQLLNEDSFMLDDNLINSDHGQSQKTIFMDFEPSEDW